MAHHLVLLLGTGPMRPSTAGGDASPAGLAREGAYRNTTYALADGAGTTASTPFVGEAILHLLPNTFDRLHIVGTADSMWDAVSYHLDPEDEAYLPLADAVRTRGLTPPPALMAPLADRVSRAFGLPTSLYVVPLPDSEANTWAMLDQLADLEGLTDGDALSLDITHGLRVQPLFLLLAARYLQAVHPRLALRHVFYGALDLIQNEVAPVFDLQPHVALLDWIEAAQAFRRYGDPAPLGALAGHHQARRFETFSDTVQLNALRDLQADARAITAAYASGAPADAPRPFAMLLPALLELPADLGDAATPWDAKLRLAQHHASGHNLGLAVLALWEALLDRIGAAYGFEPSDRTDHITYRTLGAVASGGPARARSFFDDHLPHLETRVRSGAWRNWGRGNEPVRLPLGRIGQRLRDVRNALAHADEDIGGTVFEPREVVALLDAGLVTYLRSALNDAAFDRLAAEAPWSTVSNP